MQEVYCLVSLDHRHTGALLTYSFEMKKKVIWGWISGKKVKRRKNKPWEWNSRSSPFPAGIGIHLGFLFIKALQFLQVEQECKKCLLSPLRVALSDSKSQTAWALRGPMLQEAPTGPSRNSDFFPNGGSCDLSEDILHQGELKSLAAINLGLLYSSLLPPEIQKLISAGIPATPPSPVPSPHFHITGLDFTTNHIFPLLSVSRKALSQETDCTDAILFCAHSNDLSNLVI